MSEEEFDPTTAPVSPELDTNKGIVKTPKELAGGLTLDLNESQILAVGRVYGIISRKYSTAPDTPDTHDAIDDEVATRMAEIGVLATWDRVQKTIDIGGAFPGHEIHSYGLDHERKEWEIKEAARRKETILGQRGKHG